MMLHQHCYTDLHPRLPSVTDAILIIIVIIIIINEIYIALNMVL